MIEWASELVAVGGLLGVFLLMVAENLFPPIPSEAIMPLAGVAAARGQLSLPGVIVAGIAGSLLGNAAWYELARLWGPVRMRALLARLGGARFGLGPAEVEKAEAALRRHGAWAVFLARMMPGIRTLISLPAGLVGVPRPVFYACTAAGTGLWTGGLALAGWWLEDEVRHAERWAGPFGLAVMGAVLALVLWRRWRRPRAA